MPEDGIYPAGFRNSMAVSKPDNNARASHNGDVSIQTITTYAGLEGPPHLRKDGAKIAGSLIEQVHALSLPFNPC
jgi:hypothetical protein